MCVLHSFADKNNRNTISLPGAAFDSFDLELFEFVVGENGVSFHFETKEIKRKNSKEEEEEDEEHDDDWTSKAAWLNYGPNINVEWDFGSLRPKQPFDLNHLPVVVEFEDEEEPLGIHCMDHQELHSNKIEFLEHVKENIYHLKWTGKIIVDGKAQSPKPFTLETNMATLTEKMF